MYHLVAGKFGDQAGIKMLHIRSAMGLQANDDLSEMRATLEAFESEPSAIEREHAVDHGLDAMLADRADHLFKASA